MTDPTADHAPELLPQGPHGPARPDNSQLSSEPFVSDENDPAADDLDADPGVLVRASLDPVERFPIVALCGSAGSIEALERFFQNLPPTSGMAFVVVVHLAPNQRSHLPEVLQQFTNMLVYEIEDGLKPRPNTVYVLPPDKDLSLVGGTLTLTAPTQAPGHRLPIDFFLQSLAKDARERAVAIIFSGMGSDGVVGLKMVMENFGMVMAQEPETAEYDAMPRAAVATEFIDYVLPAEELPAKLLEYAQQPVLERPHGSFRSGETRPANALQKIFLLIRTQTGHDFSLYKRNTVFRRIDRRMNAHQIRDFSQYVRFLQDNPHEVELLFKELLIGVTKFFRDPEAFEVLKGYLMPLLREKAVDSVVRVWAPGCSTGEEAYTLAMVLQECLDQLPNHYLKLQIFATDINPEGIDYARAGFYPTNIEADVSADRLKRFFTPVEGGYHIRKEVRDVVVFALHNINKDAPFIKLDLLVCRNLLIYLSSELQRNLLPVFHYALNSEALLFLGPSENMTGFQALFTPLDVKWKISRRNDVAYSLARISNFTFSLSRQASALPVLTPPVMTNPLPRKESLFVTLIQKMLLRTFAPPAVVINNKGEILFVNGRTGRYLEPAPGLGAMNVFDMAREELGFELSGAVHRAHLQHEDVTVEGVKLRTEGGYQLMRISVKYLDSPEALAGLLLVVFEEMPTSKRQRKQAQAQESLTRDSVVVALEKELQYTKHRLQTTVEEMESSLEELKSTNEELQSANEELQSTNEEAMTNKEEMQSLNEELMTLNVQYLHKTEELSQAANDMKNLLDATAIATIFLDNDMVIKRFTPPVERIISLLPTDLGRPITHFASNLRYEGLVNDVRQVLDRLVSVETNIQTHNGEWFAMRILPYRTLDNYISGAVITFIDITALKTLEEQLKASTAFAESIIENLREPLLVLDREGRVLTVNRPFAQAFGVEVDQAKGQPLTQLNRGAWRLPELQQAIGQLLETGQGFDDLTISTHFADLGERRLQLYGRNITSAGAQTGQLLLGVSRIEE
ncbi:PAS domain-containing protein [Hymenobacter sp. 15J16-1T3B]|uniref:CheR family methyltransferase n=1 Tax=Hymenobacter sp. 15J16-1T3B TaxID=2886941 RepID=UPI001D127EAA|nr:CheR family methyltransferase [Hymenobacter sp. 15J16-1T3B]MCC3157655.1 PAS domain-containing protein [Hymenobacter sp. 15J16-1T3B]